MPSVPPTPIPPRLVEAPRPSGWGPCWLLAGLVALVIGARVAGALRLPFPGCAFKQLTGHPCAFCGSTRAVLAVAHGDPAAAFRFNPLACLLGAAVVLWFVLWLVDRWRGTMLQDRVAQHLERSWLTLLLIALGLNWAYVAWRWSGG